MIRAVVAMSVAAFVMGSGGVLQAQTPAGGFKNLQVLPKDIPQDALIAAMKNFTRALGVRCQYCHVGEEGLPLEKFDFTSDVKAQKTIARAMIRMTAEVNGHVGKVIPDAAARGYQVTCFTCHRGAAHPQHTPEK